MTTKQINELSELTSEASVKNDIDSLVRIYSLLMNEMNRDKNQFGAMGVEWYSSLLTGQQWIQVMTIYNESKSK